MNATMANVLHMRNIPTSLTIEHLKEMFEKSKLCVNSIETLNSPDSAKITCPDQGVADRIIDKYNGKIMNSSRISVEPWMDYQVQTQMYRTLPKKFTQTQFPNSRTREFVVEKENEEY